ncbi:hypothetical protein V8C86DRAFT_20468 [Haematococcus lacustris]
MFADCPALTPTLRVAGPSDKPEGCAAACGERSRYLQEYAIHRPQSAGHASPFVQRKLSAIAAQDEDDSEPDRDDPWVLEGWGDEPSVVRGSENHHVYPTITPAA